MAMIARGNTALLNKILSYETSVGHGQPHIVVGLKVTKNKGLQADVLHLGSYSFRLGGQIADEVRSSEVFLVDWPIYAPEGFTILKYTKESMKALISKSYLEIQIKHN